MHERHLNLSGVHATGLKTTINITRNVSYS